MKTNIKSHGPSVPSLFFKAKIKIIREKKTHSFLPFALYWVKKNEFSDNSTSTLFLFLFAKVIFLCPFKCLRTEYWKIAVSYVLFLFRNDFIFSYEKWKKIFIQHLSLLFFVKRKFFLLSFIWTELINFVENFCYKKAKNR